MTWSIFAQHDGHRFLVSGGLGSRDKANKMLKDLAKLGFVTRHVSTVEDVYVPFGDLQRIMVRDDDVDFGDI